MKTEKPRRGLSRRSALKVPLAMAGLSIGLGAEQVGAAEPATFAKPVTIIIPFVPGTITDAVPRILAQSMGHSLGQPIVVDHKAGASGAIAAQHVARAPADGTMLLMATSTVMTINPNLQSKLPYRPMEDFALVATLLSVPPVLASRPAFAARNLYEFIALARQSPGKYTYASFGNGTTSHLIMEHLKHAAGLHVVHIPYKSGATAAAALMAGDVDVGFDSLFSAMPRVKAGQVKILGVMQPQRSRVAPEIMSTADAGYPQVGLPAWMALFAPAATPVPTLDAIAEAIRKAMGQPDIQQRLADLGTEPFALDRASFKSYMQDEAAQVGAIVRLARIEPA